MGPINGEIKYLKITIIHKIKMRVYINYTLDVHRNLIFKFRDT